MRFTFSIGGVALVDRTLLRWVQHLHDARPAFEAIANQFARAELAHFMSQGEGWAPLTPRYAAYKAAHFPGRPILVRTGELRKSLTQRPLGLEQIGGQSVVLGTGVKYAGFHQHGTPKMVARPPLRIKEPVKKQMAKTLQRYITTGAV